ncbi:MAG: hypothetical protein HC798_04780, partial [Polaribacter sp.]|nr:hypothetical protein [Polaribacter sp.]
MFSFFKSFTQKKSTENFTTTSKIVEINVNGLDEIYLENATNSEISVNLNANDAFKQNIIQQETAYIFQLSFQFENQFENDEVFRKFITTRLQNATATIYIPKDKNIVIIGENTNVICKAVNKLDISLTKSIIRLENVIKPTSILLYGGNIYAKVKDLNINVKTNQGKILVDEKKHEKNFVKTTQNQLFGLEVTSIKGNIFLTTN